MNWKRWRGMKTYKDISLRFKAIGIQVRTIVSITSLIFLYYKSKTYISYIIIKQ